jgi:hypothetical protein
MQLVVHGERFVHHRRIAAKASDPIFIAEHQNSRCAGLLVFRSKSAAKQRLHAEHVKIVPGDNPGFHAFRFASSQQDEIHVVVFDQAIQGTALLAVIADLRHRERLIQHSCAWRLLLQCHQAVAMFVRQRLQQHGIHYTENG